MGKGAEPLTGANGLETFDVRLEAGDPVEFDDDRVIFNKLGNCDCWLFGWDSCSRNATKACTKLSFDWPPV